MADTKIKILKDEEAIILKKLKDDEFNRKMGIM